MVLLSVFFVGYSDIEVPFFIHFIQHQGNLSLPYERGQSGVDFESLVSHYVKIYDFNDVSHIQVFSLARKYNRF